MAATALLPWLCLLLLSAQTTHALWNYAVTTQTKIRFYDDQLHELFASAQQFTQLAALAFDESTEQLFFSDQAHPNGSIFALQLPHGAEGPHRVHQIVARTPNELVTGIAYDALDQQLYWADKRQRKIFVVSTDNSSGVTALPRVFLDLAAEQSLPDGLAIDVCARRLYWTNSNFQRASIECIQLDGSERRVIADTQLFLPHGIVLDQLTQRLYWVDDQQGTHFAVESAQLDGGDRRVVVQGLHNEPHGLAVSKDAVYWTDRTSNAVWSHAKFANASGDDEHTPADETPVVPPLKVLSYAHEPRGILTRTRFFINTHPDARCGEVVRQVKGRLAQPAVAPNSSVPRQLERLQQHCLNGGQYSQEHRQCICRSGYNGTRCETSDCHNYCVHGTCSMSSLGLPRCSCQQGFVGQRCQSYICLAHCLNKGVCTINSAGQAECQCPEDFAGARCEHNLTAICALYCRVLQHEPFLTLPYDCDELCEELEEPSTMTTTIRSGFAIEKQQEVCHSSDHATLLIVLMCGLVASLSLVLVAVHVLRCCRQRPHPSVKKTFVIRKPMSTGADIPLSRHATRECEVTIENCCNMTICDTPCFDPSQLEDTARSEGDGSNPIYTLPRH